MNRNRVSAHERAAVVQTIAAEALEGWHPTDENTADLVELVLDRLRFNAYLAKYLARALESAGPARGKLLARRRPYLIPGTTVLRNNFHIADPALLAHLEFVATAGRLVVMHLADPAPGVPDPRDLHRAIFADVYSWAGELRITELRRGDSAFAPVDTLPRRLADIASAASALAGCTESEFAYQLAKIYALYNHTHPFREGNGRTGTFLLHRLAARHGRALDFGRIGRAEWIAAARDSMPFRRDGVPDHRPFLPIMNHVLERAHRDSAGSS